MQNKPNLLDAQMNVTSLITVDYENIANWKLGENKPNSRKAKMNISSALTKNYNNEQRTMNNERLCKTNPIKPNFYLTYFNNLRIWRENLRVWCEFLLNSPLTKCLFSPRHNTLSAKLFDLV
jgi:hypothetical protein